jgi:hypothetical protein
MLMEKQTSSDMNETGLTCQNQTPYGAVLGVVSCCKILHFDIHYADYITNPSIISILLLLSSILIGIIIYRFATFLYYYSKLYKRNFVHGNRFSRNEGKCPSFSKYDPPKVRSWDSYTQFSNLVRRQDKLHPNLLIKEEKLQKSKPAADKLDMDHIYMDPFQFFWGHTFVGLFLLIMYKRELFLLKCRLILVKVGFAKMRPVDLDTVVGKLVLEQSQVIHYVGRSKKVRSNKSCNIADFFFPDFPYVDIKGNFQVANFLSVEIDLDTKMMVSCKMDGDNFLTASEALILLFYNTISAQHVKIHALSNWGVNVDKETKEINPFLQRNSVVTTNYNFFGFTSFPTRMEGWKKEGLLSKDWNPQALVDTFLHGVKENVCQHSHITDLMPYSDFVNFITKTRSIFHCEFAKYKHLFPGVHPEGLFAGTVLHSLDHKFAELNLEDPLWLDINDPRFGKMAEVGRIVRVGFIPEVPGYYFNRHFKGSGHPFYEAVYAKAAKINKKMADSMETCICR